MPKICCRLPRRYNMQIKRLYTACRVGPGKNSENTNNPPRKVARIRNNSCNGFREKRYINQGDVYLYPSRSMELLLRVHLGELLVHGKIHNGNDLL